MPDLFRIVLIRLVVVCFSQNGGERGRCAQHHGRDGARRRNQTQRPQEETQKQVRVHRKGSPFPGMEAPDTLKCHIYSK